MEAQDRNTVFWIERRGGRETGATMNRASAPGSRGRQNVFLQATPIDVGPILRDCLWSKLDCAVLTSATLAVGGGFEYIRKRLGLEHARETVLPSHFDYQSQAVLYVPPDMPDPRTPQFTTKAAERIRKHLLADAFGLLDILVGEAIGLPGGMIAFDQERAHGRRVAIVMRIEGAAVGLHKRLRQRIEAF